MSGPCLIIHMVMLREGVQVAEVVKDCIQLSHVVCDYLTTHCSDTPSHPAALNELFTRQLLTAEEFSEVARKQQWEWEDHLNQILSTKPADMVQEACQVLEKHGYHVKKELKSELYYSSTFCQVVFQVLHYASLIVAHAPTV